MFAITVDLILLFACVVGLLDNTENIYLAGLMITCIIANALKLNYSMKKHYKEKGWIS